MRHVIGDLTFGKIEIVEFLDSENVEFATRAIGERAAGAITAWRRAEGARPEADRFVGILNSLDVVAFIAKSGDQEKAMKTAVAEVVQPNQALLKEVDPGTRYGF